MWRYKLAIVIIPFLLFGFAAAQSSRKAEKDRQTIIALEQEWLHAEHDATTLDRILASDFVHVVPVDHFLTKQEHIDWAVKHPEPKDRHTKFDKLNVRLYRDVGIANGSVVATDASGKELGRTMFTDVFVYRDGRWQAVNAQENAVRPIPHQSGNH
jgi:Domain of unknown function (DUF4440)